MGWPEGLMCYLWDSMLCVICMLYDYMDRTGGSNDSDRARGPNELWPDRRVQRAAGLEGPVETSWPEGRVSLERRICGMWYIGELTKHYAYSCCVWCLRYQRGPWEGDGLTRTHSHRWSSHLRDLGNLFWKHCCFGFEIMIWYTFCGFKNLKFNWKFYVVTIVFAW